MCEREKERERERENVNVCISELQRIWVCNSDSLVSQSSNCVSYTTFYFFQKMHSKMTECQGQQHCGGSWWGTFPTVGRRGQHWQRHRGCSTSELSAQQDGDLKKWWLPECLNRPKPFLRYCLVIDWRVVVNSQGTASSTGIYWCSFLRGVCEHLLPQASTFLPH